jgi:hypothetical protein
LRELLRDGMSLAARLRCRVEASRAQMELSRLYLGCREQREPAVATMFGCS